MIIIKSRKMIFDDVAFGIAVRDRRIAYGKTQGEVARAVGWKDGVSISSIECAKATDTISVRKYMTLCNVLDLNPMHFWDIDPSNDALAERDWMLGDV